MLWVYVFYVRGEELTWRGRTFTLRAQGVLLFLFSMFVLFVATNVSSLLMGSLFGGCAVCTFHAVMRTPEPEPEGEKGVLGGFTDFVGSAISQNTAAIEKMSDLVPVKWSRQMDGLTSSVEKMFGGV